MSLTSAGFTVPNKLLKSILQHNYNTFLESLTIKFEPKIGMPVFTKLYSFKFVGATYCIILPRTFVSRMRKYMTITVSLPEPLMINPVLGVELYPDQIQIINALYEKNFTETKIGDGEGCALLNLGAGRGKTMVSAGLIAKIKYRCVYVVPVKPLANQALGDMTKAFGTSISIDIFSSAKYGYLSGNYTKKFPKVLTPLPDILIIVINSAITNEWLFAHYSMMILDEVHTYCSEQRKAIFKRCLRVVFGMSATTHENEKGLDVISHKELAFGGITYGEVVSAQEDVPKFDCDVQVIKYWGPDEYSKALTHESTGILFVDYMHNQAIADPYRMNLVLNELRELYEWRGKSGERHLIYIFCEKLEPLGKTFDRLKDIYGEELAIPEFKSLTGGAKAAELEETRANANIILTTYGYGGTGISINRATAILFLTSRKAKMKQILARILRRGSDTTIRRQVRDIVDVRTPLQHQVKKRMIAYELYGMTINERFIRYDHSSLMPNEKDVEI